MLNYIKFKLQGRSSLWRSVRANYLDFNCACAACNSRYKLEVHHVLPFKDNPENELETSNLITLCKHCHLVLGHLKDYKIANNFVRDDVKSFSERRKLAYLLRK